MNVTSSSSPSTSIEMSLTDAHTSLEESVLLLNRKKNVAVIVSDSSCDEGESFHEDETPDLPTNTSKIVDESLLSQNESNGSGEYSNVADPVFNKSNITTPRAVKAVIDSDSDSEVEVVEASSEEENVASYVPSARKLAQKYTLPLNKFSKDLRQGFENSSLLTEAETSKTPPSNSEDEFITVEEYLNQKKKVEALESDLQTSKTTLKTVNLSALPDKGLMLTARQSSLEAALQMAQAKLSKMKVNEELTAQVKTVATWDELQTASTSVQPKTFGKTAMATYNAQKAVTMDRLHQLHSSINTCPTEDILATDPKGLRIELMAHQKHALAWLIWRESQKPSGGILADDMGLGKTLTMISLMLKQRELQESGDSSDEENTPPNRKHKSDGGNLIICPASVLKQWEEEVKKHCKKYLLTVECYHGPKRETRTKSLAKYDMVITTYAICMSEFKRGTPINCIYWRRIILDEAHQIKNFKCTTSKAVCELSAKSRWALTGTPVHNKELDMYSLLKFLRCSPFDDIAVWKRWVSDKSHGGQERLHTVLSSLMLRRTKQQLQERGVLTCLPDRQWELIEITLNKAETDVYQKVLIFSRTLFAQFLHQRAERDTDRREEHETFNYANVYAGNEEYHKMHKMLLKLNKVRTVQQHHILMLLLRLRQICCHPFLITSMLRDEDTAALGDDDEKPEEINILEQLSKLNVNDDFNAPHDDDENSVALGALLNSSNPVFKEQYKSSKIQAVMKKLKECVLQNGDKAVVVSQFSSFLRIIAIHLKQENINFQQLDGSVPVHKRKDIIADFNNHRHPTRILLLSLTAGGVGLNLVGGNHLFLIDLHWNPQLEMQAQDRIYRVGQSKSVYVYKFITADTIEQRIKQLQDRKLDIANSMLTGAKLQQSKLSLQDLKMLFNM